MWHCRGAVYFTLLALCASVPAVGAQSAAGEWPAYGRDAGGSRYSPLTQITPDNVAQLEIAWIHRTGDVLHRRGRFQSTPVLVDGTLYVSTPLGRVNALDPVTGAERWTFDPFISLEPNYGDFANRGVSTWLDTSRGDGEPCRRRIFVAPIDARLIALDARSGSPCVDFGSNGTVNLRVDLDPAPASVAEYQVTSPPAVVGDLIIVGSAIADNNRTDAPSGVVRAFDARTGRMRWVWDPIPRSRRDPAWSTWERGSGARTGAANVWTVITADAERDLVFLPTSSASPDFYGGERLGQNLYANSLVALRASTGEVVWHQQLVHHDIWDYDIASPAALFTMRREGRDIPAVAQTTKMGLLFIFNRETGEPLHEIEERPVPASDVPGERAWPTQPFPVRPAPLAPHELSLDQLFGLTPADLEACRARIAPLRNEGIYTPPSLRGSLVYPGNVGGSNWGGVAVHGGDGIIVGATNRLAFSVTLVPRAAVDSMRRAGHDVSQQRGTPYGMMRAPLMSAQGVPCGPPPWGALTAVDAASGERLWEVSLGYVPQLAEHVPQARQWGSVNMGGPIVTASGLVFIAATADGHLRAFNIRTGQELWAGPLPRVAMSTPMTYEADGRQYVVIASGGHDRMTFGELGDHLVAFALPDGREPPVRDELRVVGQWEGDLRVGDVRAPLAFDLATDGERVTGSLRATQPVITGELEGSVDGDTLRIRARFDVPEVPCRGVFDAVVDIANGGTLLVGIMDAESNCGSSPRERGTFSLRRSGGG